MGILCRAFTTDDFIYVRRIFSDSHTAYKQPFPASVPDFLHMPPMRLRRGKPPAHRIAFPQGKEAVPFPALPEVCHRQESSR